MRILIGIDFSKPSELAVEEIARRPWPPETEIRLASVVERVDSVEVIRQTSGEKT